MAFQKPPLSATILTILGIAVLCVLGTWQIQRLAWKENILSRIATQTSYDKTIPAGALETLAYNGDKNLYERGTIYGRFTGQTRHLMPRTHEGQSGKHVLAPFITENNQFLLVNLGWVPFDYKSDYTFDLSRAALQGVLRRPDKKTWLTPDNDDTNGIWYAIDFDEMGQGFVPEGYSVMPAVFYNEAALSFADIIPHTKGWQPPNNHLAYACFWYIMACVLAAIFFLRFIVSPARKTENNDE